MVFGRHLCWWSYHRYAGEKREDFQRLINDCMNGDVDMVITKSISRFARNTLDTLKYVRMLKDKGVAVFLKKKTSTPLLWTANCSLWF